MIIPRRKFSDGISSSDSSQKDSAKRPRPGNKVAIPPPKISVKKSRKEKNKPTPSFFNKTMNPSPPKSKPTPSLNIQEELEEDTGEGGAPKLNPRPSQHTKTSKILRYKIEEIYTKKRTSRQSGLRWIVDTEKNRSLLIDYLAKRAMIDWIKDKNNMYSTIFNVFYSKREVVHEDQKDKDKDELHGLALFFESDQRHQLCDVNKKVEKEIQALKAKIQPEEKKAKAKELKIGRQKIIEEAVNCFFSGFSIRKPIQVFKKLNLAKKQGCFRIPLFKYSLNKQLRENCFEVLEEDEAPLELKIDLIPEIEVDGVEIYRDDEQGREAWNKSKQSGKRVDGLQKRLRRTKENPESVSELAFEQSSKDTDDLVIESSSSEEKNSDEEMSEISALVQNLQKAPKQTKVVETRSIDSLLNF